MGVGGGIGVERFEEGEVGGRVYGAVGEARGVEGWSGAEGEGHLLCGEEESRGQGPRGE